MSALAAVLNRDGAPVDALLLRRMLARMPWRGGAVAGVHAADSACLAVAHHDWQRDGGAPTPTVVEAGGVWVAADASLYYRDDLVAALARAGVRPTGASSAHLILAAYLAWGERCVDRLEGDYAFVIRDGRARTLFCARDFAGSRPLYYADLGHAVVVASSAAAVLEHPACPGEPDLALVAEMAIGQFGVGDASGYAAVSQLPAAHAITFHEDRRRGGAPRRTWSPPQLTPYREVAPRDAAEGLRELLVRAVRERLDGERPTAVWLSGGHDSTAVYAAGRHALGDGGDAWLRPVTLSYPPGDPAREDEHVQPVLEHWGARGHRVDITRLAAVGDPTVRPRRPDDPYVHPYEAANVAVVAGCRGVGARVALNGMGADILFSLAPDYLADLFWQGRWAALAGELRARPWRSLRLFHRWVLRPRLPAWARWALDATRGRFVVEGFERLPVPWMRRDLVARLGLDARPRRWRPGPPPRSTMQRAFELYFAYPVMARNMAELESLALARGVELRRPFLDRRLIEFAAGLPWWEKQRGTEKKLVLRRAMRGLLPEEALGVKPRLLGNCNAYFAGRAARTLTGAIRRAMRDSLLVDLGVIDVAALERTLDAFAAGRGLGWFPDLQWTLSAELWLRERVGAAALLQAIGADVAMEAA